MDFVAAAVFITCHPGPSQHFANFVQALPKTVHTQVYAAGPALETFRDRNTVVTPFDLENTEAKAAAIAHAILEGSPAGFTPVAVIDIGHPFATKMARALKERNIVCLTYYDNPQSYVPGGYSKEAYQTILAATGVIFANAKLAQGPIWHEPAQEMMLSDKPRIGLGHSPIIEKASALNERRKSEQPSLREKLLPLDFKGKKVIVYFGGNNDEYFGNGQDNEGAFPAFLRLLSESSTDLSRLVFVIQQHPGAKPREFENKLIAAWEKQYSQNPYAPKLFISNFGFDEAQVIADGAMYHQTSMSAQFALLEGVVTLQVGHNIFEDSLTKIGFPSVTTAAQLESVIGNWDKLAADQASEKAQVLDSLGSDPKWVHTLEQVVLHPSSFIKQPT